MRVVPDTNVVVSGLIWGGPPRQLLDLARHGAIVLYTSTVLLAELDDVLSRDKFAVLLASRKLTPQGIARGYASLARAIVAPAIPRTVPTDADDDAVIACALAAKASLIATGDADLLALYIPLAISPS
jgi:putative PIN family toxin of toxin-antitoxin system